MARKNFPVMFAGKDFRIVVFSTHTERPTTGLCLLARFATKSLRIQVISRNMLNLTQDLGPMSVKCAGKAISKTLI